MISVKGPWDSRIQANRTGNVGGKGREIRRVWREHRRADRRGHEHPVGGHYVCRATALEERAHRVGLPRPRLACTGIPTRSILEL
jgi:hypothetical protein